MPGKSTISPTGKRGSSMCVRLRRFAWGVVVPYYKAIGSVNHRLGCLCQGHIPDLARVEPIKPIMTGVCWVQLQIGTRLEI
jgi:hypothetical protein